MASQSSSYSDDEMITGINVTPLVDVVLVLLVIFLITAPTLYQNAMKVELPQAKTGEASDVSPLSFTLSRTGELQWKDQLLTWPELTTRLAALADADRNQPALISADEGTTHGTVVKLIDALRQAGIHRFALNVQQTE